MYTRLNCLDSFVDSISWAHMVLILSPSTKGILVMIKKSIFSLSLIIAAGVAFTPALTNADPCVAQGKAASASILADDSSSAPSQDQMNGSTDQSQSSDQQDSSSTSNSDPNAGSMGSTGSDGTSDDSNSSE